MPIPAGRWLSPGSDSEGCAVPLNFPNASRSFDPTRDRVRFWGYDQSMEISFFVEATALGGSVPAAEHEAELLRNFDRHIDRIHAAARAAYARGRQSAYVLTEADLGPTVRD